MFLTFLLPWLLPSSHSPGPSKVNLAALEQLATEEDVSDLLNLYNEYFDQVLEEEEEPPIPDALPEMQKLNNCGGDFGMKEERTMKPLTIAIYLGYRYRVAVLLVGLAQIKQHMVCGNGIKVLIDAEIEPRKQPQHFYSGIESVN